MEKFLFSAKKIAVIIVLMVLFGASFPVFARVRAQDLPRDEQFREMSISERIFIDVRLPQRPIYVNEQVIVNILFYSDWLDIENLKISDEPSKDYIARDYVSRKTSVELIGGIRYAVLEYQRELFIPNPGSYTFGPVKATFDITREKDIPLNDNVEFYNRFIGRHPSRRMEIKTDVFPITVINVPVMGKPGSFTGAIGKFNIEPLPVPRTVKQGDTITLEARITGEGTLSSMTVPVLSGTDGFEVDAPRARRTETGLLARFDLKAIDDTLTRFPDIIFTYFEPDKADYVSITSPGAPLEVLPTPDLPFEIQVAEVEEEPAPDAIVGLKPGPGRLFQKQDVLFSGEGERFQAKILTPLIILLVLAAVKKHSDILASDSPYARRVRAVKMTRDRANSLQKALEKGDKDAFYTILSETLRGYIGTRFQIPSKNINHLSIDTYLRRFDVSPDTRISVKIKSLLDDIHLALYSTAVFGKKDMDRAFQDLREIIAEMDRKRSFRGKTR